MRASPTAARRSFRVISAVLVAAVVAAVGAGAATAHPVDGSDANGTYLALGDSVAFGYVPQGASPAPDYFDAHSFVGYPEYLAQQLNERVSNASCPGETTASLLYPDVQSFGCENQVGSPIGYRTVYPLHVEYRGTQIDYALHYLAVHRDTRLITIDIGANDAFLCQALDKTDQCATKADLTALAYEIETNLAQIFHDLQVVAGYHGPIVVLTYYSLNYTDPVQVESTLFLDGVIAGVTKAYGGIVADGFTAFEGPSYAKGGGDPCAAGLLIRLSPTTCDVHPSPAGQRLLARTIAGAIGP